ncbi:YbbR-like domain-containing protein [Halobacteriovorax sp. HLS]|uniref:CdaR family protein n=1 Tax=Halobacteriovorax sp. HLS TaxID=2234000 RepID=UPI000FD718E2|nr:CdaR family protein [Halobacteriovorax sp. HLS]
MKRFGRGLEKDDALSRHFLKLVSVLFASFLWFYVLNSEPQIVEQSMHLRLLTPAGKSISNIVPQKVAVKIKGSRAFVRTVLNQELSVVVDLKKYSVNKKGGFRVFLTHSDVTVPFGVEVISITPESFNVELQKEIRKEVAVKPVLTGNIAPDLKLINTSVSPKTVLISGPIEVMRKVSKVQTVPIDISSLQGEGDIKIALADLDQRVSIDRNTPVDFNYTLKPRKANLTLKKIKISFLSTSTKISSKVKYVSLDVLAPEGVRLNKSDIQIIAEVPESKGTHSVKLRANLPEGIHLLQINPQSINVSTR